MRAPVDKNNDLFLFPEGLPCTQAEQFRSECPPDKKTKVEDLFQFSRGTWRFAYLHHCSLSFPVLFRNVFHPNRLG